MKVLPPSLLLCALLTAAIGCKKADVSPSWVLVDSTPTARAEIDSNHIVRHGDVRNAPMRITYTADATETHAWHPVQAHAGYVLLIHTDYNCATGEFRDTGWTDRDHESELAISINPAPVPFQAVAPGTYYEAALKYVCASPPR